MVRYKCADMLPEVSENVIELAVHCKKQHSCLNNNHHKCCKIVKCIDEKLHFLGTGDHEYCGYKTSFGESCLCRCPVRKEIYNLHKK